MINNEEESKGFKNLWEGSTNKTTLHGKLELFGTLQFSTVQIPSL